MNDTRPDHDLPAALRMQLRALRMPEPPARELWPGIAARIAAQPQAAATAPHRRTRLFPAIAAAAVLALAIGVGWQLRPPGAEPAQASSSATAAPAVPTAPLVIVADAMTREYRGALREVPSPRLATPGYDSLLELDASAAAVRDALAQDPDAVFLLQRLQHIHARRLALTRQLASA